MRGSIALARLVLGAGLAVGVAVGLAVGVGGCASSPPMRFYTLSPASSDFDQNTPPAIRVVRVRLPSEIDRPQIVQRVDPNRVKLAEQDRWAAPLGEMIRRTLSADIQALQPAAGAQSAAAPASLHVDIEEFMGGADCAVSLRAGWSLERAGDDSSPTRGFETIHVEAPPTCQVSAIPAAMSRALAELSRRIASASAASMS